MCVYVKDVDQMKWKWLIIFWDGLLGRLKGRCHSCGSTGQDSPACIWNRWGMWLVNHLHIPMFLALSRRWSIIYCVHLCLFSTCFFIPCLEFLNVRTTVWLRNEEQSLWQCNKKKMIREDLELYLDGLCIHLEDDDGKRILLTQLVLG